MEKVYVMMIDHQYAYAKEWQGVLVFRNKADAISTMYAQLKQDYYDQMDDSTKAEFDEAMENYRDFFEWCGQFDASVWETTLF